MFQERAGRQEIELLQEISLPGDVCFDPESLSLHGFYKDQLSAYRARNIWIETLQDCFLLDRDHDFKIEIQSEIPKTLFTVRCDFLSACARYAFWRLTNHQAPEVQYIIETAHIPDTEANQSNFVMAPDMKPLSDKQEPQEAALPEKIDQLVGQTLGPLETVKKLLNRIIQWK